MALARFPVTVLAVLPTVSRIDLSFDRDFVPRDFVDFVDFDESPKNWLSMPSSTPPSTWRMAIVGAILFVKQAGPKQPTRQ